MEEAETNQIFESMMIEEEEETLASKSCKKASSLLREPQKLSSDPIMEFKGRQSKAMKFAQDWFPYFKESKLKEIKSLMGAFAHIPALCEFIKKQNIKNSPQLKIFFDAVVKSQNCKNPALVKCLELISADQWFQLQKVFVQQFCKIKGMS